MFYWLDPALLAEFKREGTDAHRLCTTNLGWVERFGSDILISYKNETAREKLKIDFHLWEKTARFESARIFGRFLPKQDTERTPPRFLFGIASENLQSTAMERKLRFGIDFAAGYSVGLFLDQRENRSYVRDLAPRRLLNCFAYTCSFSVAAASAGAETVNVDLSKKWLARGRENFSLNNLRTSEHRFVEDDVRPFLRRLARRGEKFDVIILDPPTFARAPKGKVFHIERDFDELLMAALEIAEGDARILLSTNCAALNESALEALARACLKRTKRAGKLHRSLRPVDFPAAAGASSIWLTLR